MSTARFPDDVAAELLASCKRHCCVCLRWRGRNLEIHHIQPVARGGQGTFDNGIPVCFDCHAEIESKSNMGRKFSADELRRHRDGWFTVVREHAEKLLVATRERTDSGPLEALLSELNFNLRVVSAKEDLAYPPLENAQFRRAIAANALATLPAPAATAVYDVYRAVGVVNYSFERLLNLRAASGDYGPTEKERNKLRDSLRDTLIPFAVARLEEALGREPQGVR